MSYVGGLDIGSVATKAVVGQSEGETLLVVGRGLAPTGWRPIVGAEQALELALDTAGLYREDLAALGATGYGRDLLLGAGVRATEVTCQARGMHHLLPNIRTVVDIGGQDSKILRVNEFGDVLDFALNDRCAAGTGRFLEVMARALGMTLDEMGRSAVSAAEVCTLSSTCTVFAESEVIGLLARGHSREAVAAGLCHAIARQVIALAAQIGLERPVALTGGVAHNEGVRAALAAQLDAEVIVPENPQYTAALGAAILAAKVRNQRP